MPMKILKGTTTHLSPFFGFTGKRMEDGISRFLGGMASEDCLHDALQVNSELGDHRDDA